MRRAQGIVASDDQEVGRSTQSAGPFIWWQNLSTTREIGSWKARVVSILLMLMNTIQLHTHQGKDQVAMRYT